MIRLVVLCLRIDHAKVSVGFDPAKETEKGLKKEISGLRKSLEKVERDNAHHAQCWREARTESDKLKEEKEVVAREIEDLRRQLEAANIRAVVEYNRGVDVAARDYVNQMPIVKDAVWDTAWRRCLTKLEVDLASPH